MSLLSYIQTIPKAELHVHLEGAIQPPTLLQLAQRNRVDLPATTIEGLARWLDYRDFDHFIEVFVTACRCLRSTEDYELAVYEFGVEMARQNIRYAEVTFSPSTHYVLGVSHDTYFSGLQLGRARVQEDFGIEIAWIFNIVRQWTDRTRTRPLADYTTSVAIDGKDDGVVALGLGGAEVGAPPEEFAPWFDRARAAGLHAIPHAGEMVGPESIWGALQSLGAERIGHGVRAIEDPALVTYLAERAIPLEVCPRSNVYLGVYGGLEDHPLPRLYEAGLVITVNSDDPALLNTSLSDDLATLVDPFHMDITAIDQIVLNGIRASFLPPDRKQFFEARFGREIDVLKPAHLG